MMTGYLGIVDVPFSFAADTVLLPVTVPIDIIHHHQTSSIERRRIAARNRIETARLNGDHAVLFEEIESDDQEIQQLASHALIELNTEWPVEPLIHVLSEGEINARCRALDALASRVKDPVVHDVVLNVLEKDENVIVLYSASQAAAHLLPERRAVFAMLIAAGRSGDSSFPITSILNSMAMNDQGAMSAELKKAIESDDPLVRRGVVRTISRDQGNIQTILYFLDDRDAGVRLAALSGAFSYDDKRLYEPVIEACYDDDQTVSDMAFQRLLEFDAVSKDIRFLSPLIYGLKHASIICRDRIPMRLAELGDPQAIEPLIESLAGQDDLTRREVVRALKALTNADFGARQAKWRRWWSQNKVRFLVAEPLTQER